MTRFIGFDEVYNCDSTGLKTFYIFFIPVWSKTFYHSTTWDGTFPTRGPVKICLWLKEPA
jgi:hypothetical protein